MADNLAFQQKVWFTEHQYAIWVWPLTNCHTSKLVWHDFSFNHFFSMNIEGSPCNCSIFKWTVHMSVVSIRTPVQSEKLFCRYLYLFVQLELLSTFRTIYSIINWSYSQDQNDMSKTNNFNWFVRFLTATNKIQNNFNMFSERESLNPDILGDISGRWKSTTGFFCALVWRTLLTFSQKKSLPHISTFIKSSVSEAVFVAKGEMPIDICGKLYCDCSRL